MTTQVNTLQQTIAPTNWWEQSEEQAQKLKSLLKAKGIYGYTSYQRSKEQNNIKRNGKSKSTINTERQEAIKSHFAKSDITYPKYINNGLIKLDNLDQIAEKKYYLFNGEACLYFEKPFKYVEVKLPHGKVEYHMYGKVLKAIGYQFKACNPKITTQELNDYLVHFFAYYVKFSLKGNFDYDSILIKKISNTVMDTKGILKYRKRNTLFNPDYDLTSSEKLAERNKVAGAIKSGKGLDEVKKLVDKGGLTKQQMADEMGISLSTLKRKIKLLDTA